MTGYFQVKTEMSKSRMSSTKNNQLSAGFLCEIVTSASQLLLALSGCKFIAMFNLSMFIIVPILMFHMLKINLYF